MEAIDRSLMPFHSLVRVVFKNKQLHFLFLIRGVRWQNLKIEQKDGWSFQVIDLCSCKFRPEDGQVVR